MSTSAPTLRMETTTGWQRRGPRRTETRSSCWRVCDTDASFAFPNAWVRLKRVGQTFTTHYGANGLDWVQRGDSFTAETAYPDTVMLGIASSSIDNAGNGGNSHASFEYSQYGPSVTETSSPRLTVSSAGQAVVIAWPASTAGFQLQQSPQLGTGAAWTVVTTAPVVSGM